MRHVLSELLNALQASRFVATHAMLSATLGASTVAIRLLPKQHPSRIYIGGRIKMAKSNIGVALRHPKP